MTSVATSFFASPPAPSAQNGGTAAQAGATAFGAMLGFTAANDTGANGLPMAAVTGAGVTGDAAVSTTGIATLLATASIATAAVPVPAPVLAAGSIPVPTAPASPIAAKPEDAAASTTGSATPPATASIASTVLPIPVPTTLAAPASAMTDDDAVSKTEVAAPPATASIEPAAEAPVANPAALTAPTATVTNDPAAPKMPAETGASVTLAQTPVSAPRPEIPDGRDVSSPIDKTPLAEKSGPRPAPRTRPAVYVREPSRIDTATDPADRPPIDRPATAATLMTEGPAGEPSAVGDADRPKPVRSKADRPLAPASEPPVVLIAAPPLAPAAITPVATPQTTPARTETKPDAKSNTAVAASSPRPGSPIAGAPLPVAADHPVAPTGDAHQETPSGAGGDASARSPRAAAAADTAPDPSTAREGSPAFTPLASPAPAASAEHRASSPAATITAAPGRIGQELGVAIAHHVSGGDATGGGDTITLRLNPVDMGRIEVKLSFDDGGTLRAVVSADNPAALDMLRRDSADLGRALHDAGVRADAQTLRFDTRADTGQGGGSGQGNHRQPEPRGTTSADRSDIITATDDITAAYRPLRTRGGIDMVA